MILNILRLAVIVPARLLMTALIFAMSLQYLLILGLVKMVNLAVQEKSHPILSNGSVTNIIAFRKRNRGRTGGLSLSTNRKDVEHTEIGKTAED